MAILLDGGMGKALEAAGAPFRQPEWSAAALLDEPDAVRRVHADFLAAGADVITTSNYAVVPFHLGEDRFAELGPSLTALAGRMARLAVDAAPAAARVAGSIPPLFGSYEPASFDPERAPEMLAMITKELAPHVDLFLAETQSSIAEARVSAAAAVSTGLPLWVSFTLAEEPVAERAQLRSGEPVGDAARSAVDSGAEAVLFNCSQPEIMAPAIDEAITALPASIPVGVFSNAFEPKPEHYRANSVILRHRADLDPAGYRAFVEGWLDQGARIVGGCCGIMASHIAELRRLLD